MTTFSSSTEGRKVRQAVDSPTAFSSGLTPRQEGFLKQAIQNAMAVLGDGQEYTSKTVAATVTSSSCVVSIT